MPIDYNQTKARPSALELFTDRENEQDVLMCFFEALAGEGSRPHVPVLHFYGVGGIGKTTLFHKVQERWHSQQNKRLKILYFCVDDNSWSPKRSSFEFFKHLRAKMHDLDIPAPLFDCLRLAIWAKSNPGENCTLENSPFSELAKKSLNQGDFWATVCGEVAALTSVGFNPVALLDTWWGKIRQKNWAKKFKETFGKDPADPALSIRACEGYLAHALALDTQEFLTDNKPQAFCLLLDGFERVQSTQNLQDIQNAFQEWIARLAQSGESIAPRFGVVIAGREKLRWRELYDEASTPAAQSWDALIEPHILGGLSHSDASNFLQKAAKTIVDIPVRDQLEKNRDALLAAARQPEDQGGESYYPYYLDLALDIVFRKGVDFCPDMLGPSPQVLQQRFLSNLDVNELRVLQVLALASAFDEPLFRYLVERKVIIEYPIHYFGNLLANRSYVSPHPTQKDSFVFNRHMQDALVASQKAKSEDRDAAKKVLTEILEFHHARFKFDKPADFTRINLVAHKAALRLLTSHLETELMEIDWVGKELQRFILEFDFQTLAQFEPIESLHRAVEKRVGSEHPVALLLLRHRGALLGQKGDYIAAEPLLQRTWEVRARTLGTDHPDTLSSANDLGELFLAKGDYAAAKPLLFKAQETCKRTLGPDHPQTLTAINSYAGTLLSMGNPQLAEPFFREALAVSERVLGADHPQTLTSMNNLAGTLLTIGKFELAEPLCRKALLLSERILGSEHPKTFTCTNNLAGTLLRLGQPELAEPLFRQALVASERLLGPEHPHTRMTLTNLRMTLYQIGKS